ncbi:MAG: hypothetical protein LKJ25_11790 [Clostridia bacterium]|jgi:hypothetical protein|nr:hypothetical protein [Clostridia bacterium]
MSFLDKKNDIKLTETDKKIRLAAFFIGLIIIAAFAVMYLFGFGKSFFSVDYKKNGTVYSYSPKNGKITLATIDADKNPDFEGWDYVRPYNSGKTALLSSENSDNTFKIGYYDGKRVKDIVSSCTDAAMAGKYCIYESDGEIYFSNIKDKPIDMKVRGPLSETVELSSDGRYILLISGNNRQLNIFSIDISGEKITGGTKLFESVKTASFTGRKHDIGFIDSNNNFYFSSNGYADKEDENISNLTTGSDTMSFYYLKNNDAVIRFNEGKKKELVSGIKDFAYIGNNKICVLKDFDGNKGNLYSYDGKEMKLIDRSVSSIERGYLK